MRFFHLSDLHIGLKLFNKDLGEDQEYILNEIIRLAEEYQPDAVIIAGDIYDKAIPSAEAALLFDRFVSGLSRTLPSAEIMMISGNHDSAPRVNVFRNVLRHQHIHMIGIPPQEADEKIEKVTLHDGHGPVNFYLLPFVRPSMVKKAVGQGEEDEGALSYDETLRRLIGREEICPEERNVLVSHQFYVPAHMEADQVERTGSEIITVGNIDQVSADVLEPFDYAALGHIHKPMQVGSEVFRYCGTPLACSVSEAGQEKGVIMVQMEEKGKVETEVLPLIPLRKVQVISGSLEEVLLKGCDDYVTVSLTDRVDLDVIDMQDRIRNAFPNLLEIRRDYQRTADHGEGYIREEEQSPFELCRSFLKEMTPGEEELLRDIINKVQEETV